MRIINARLPEHDTLVSILIDDGIITAIGDNAPDSGALDAKGCWVLPGLVDLNFNLQDPGNRSVESLGRAIMDAAKGGITHIVAKPYTDPVVDKEITMEYLHARLHGQKGARLSILASATLDGKGEALSEQATLYHNGALGCHTYSDINANILRRTFEYAWMQQKMLFVSCRNRELEAGGVMAEGETASRMGLPTVLPLAQSTEVAKVCEMARYLKAETLLQEISTQESIELIRSIRQSTPLIHAEVGIDHLILDDTACDGFNTFAKVSPPLENSRTKAALVAAVKEGVIEVIATHHTAKSLNSKDMPFDLATDGTRHAGYFLPLLYTHLIKPGILSLPEVIKACSTTPAELIGDKQAGRIAIGRRADMVIFDPEGSTPVDESINSPFRGTTLQGCVSQTIVNGEPLL